MPKPVVLTILDGFGVSDESRGNAVKAAKKPNFQYIGENFPGAKLQAAGIAVGVPWGEVGSSEVGHINIGAGMVIYQSYPRISLAIQDGSFFEMDAWNKAITRPNVHLIGLLTDSGIHAHIDHLLALIKMLAGKKYKGGVFVHLFTDGEDAAPRSAQKFVKMVENEIAKNKIGAIATLAGRYWAMDREKNWDRTERVVKSMIDGSGTAFATPEQALETYYAKDVGDEMIEPTVIVGASGQPVGLLKSNDAVIFFNFRPDRARQLTERLEKVPDILIVTMTQYEKTNLVMVAFPPQHITDPLAKIISDAGKKQLHISESEKYAHSTYFFNGGREEPFTSEDRIVVPSNKVSGHDQKPEMAAREITEKVIEALDSGKYDFIMLNFANGDMVGHTGNFQAATKAVEALDECVGKIMKKVLELDGAMVITADHGNCEETINLRTGKADTEHSTNPVPFYIIGNQFRLPPSPIGETTAEPTGILADVAPTILDIMNITKPKVMTGQSLLGQIGKLLL